MSFLAFPKRLCVLAGSFFPSYLGAKELQLRTAKKTGEFSIHHSLEVTFRFIGCPLGCPDPWGERGDEIYGRALSWKNIDTFLLQ
ncbi:hypothetical protein CDAR_175831 [Caerostris darwini]|uniref:Uncharacterized protein n=1 Tax=Caerostris darwini TaxID=1538125 RepID=A0AAV4WXW4_9ARAC|nr:hypothetical protein CDAR_175831 [Caerostris darwini]